MVVKENDVGRRCTVAFDDIGHVDAMIVDFDEEHTDHRVYVFVSSHTDLVTEDQIIDIGDAILPRSPDQ